MRFNGNHAWSFCGVLLLLVIISILNFDGPKSSEVNTDNASSQPKFHPNKRLIADKLDDRITGEILTRTEKKWTVFNQTCRLGNDFVLAHLTNPPKTPIYVYPPTEDVHVSKSIINRGDYEGPWVNKIVGFMKRFPDAVFLDIGANVGMFSISLAALGYRVVAVDCLKENIMRVCASRNAGNLTNKLTIVYNAISDKYEKVSLGRYKGDVGGTYIKEGVPTGGDSIDTILLDDLLEIYNFERVIVKMDVEKSEDKVLRGGYKFFERVRVEALLMEFNKHKDSKSGGFIVDFLTSHGLEPEVPKNVRDNYSKWQINNILFKRSKAAT